MKTKLLIPVSFLVMFILSIATLNVLSNSSGVYAANTAQATCEKTYGQKERVEACVPGYNAGYKGDTIEEACGSSTNQKKPFTYGPGGTYSYCAGGQSFGAAQRKKDGVVIPKPTGSSLDQRAKTACKSKVGETGTRADACQRGYKAAYTSGATSDSVTQACDKESSNALQADCKTGVELANRDNIEVEEPSTTANQVVGAPGSTNSGGQPQLDCDASGVPLSWIICPVIDLGAGISDFAFQQVITPLLVDVPVSADPKSPIYDAWTSFRILANVFLVGSLLAIVYSQAKGGK